MKIGIIFGLIILILAVGFIVLKPGEEAKPEEEEIKIEEKEVKEEIPIFSPEEKEMIEVWIIEQDLNQYGDPKDTVYLGGTPLFDERTGRTIEKYEYILENNPDRPWLQPQRR